MMKIFVYYEWEKAMLVCLNKIKFIPIFILIIFFVDCFNLIENIKFNQLSKDFLNQYFQYHPVQATLTGIHDYDDQLAGYSKQNMNELIRFYKLSSEKIASLDTSKLSNTNKINYQILSQHIKLKLFELEEWTRWQRDATYYIQNIYDAISSLHYHTKDSTETPTKNLISRLDQIPGMIANAKQNLQSLSDVNLAAVIEQIENQTSIIAFQLSDKFVISEALVDSFNKKSEIVVDTLENFIKFLESKNKSSAASSLQMTPELYKTYISLLLNINIEPEELIEWIDADYQNNYDDILSAANRILNETKKKNEVIREHSLFEKVNDEFEKKSLTKNEIIPYCYEFLQEIKRFIDEILNLSLSIDFDILIDWAGNDRMLVLKLADSENPGLLEPEPRYLCLVKPILNDRDWIQQLSELREYNKPSLKVAIILEAMPSHYQVWVKNLENIPKLAKVFPDQVLVNGWHYYFAFSMLNSGFDGYDPELQYVLLKNYARILLLAKVEIQYYLQKLTDQQVERLLLESNMFKKSEIDDVRYQLNYSPGKALTIYWAVRQLKKMQDICHKQLGPHFNMNDFFQHILKQGPLPIKLISWKSK